ncbi:HK97-gp10 family putative phage morphogenesis protein [Carnobacterium maltaromaticum]|uniref:HK97-gp10 family putative phage morphogenesis protein n=1 Tax=Carnobacterium maltaromaticum TaxID=2751 RepID=UPI00191BCB00|nr:HK97-gp10 family putative phage morphogenesis protein [Carnobacterium maltaromaticum]CAD5902447.1 conserved hypothetical protein [Carnobacterium maltaromaticum]
MATRNNNGFEDAMENMGRLVNVNEKVSIEALTAAAEFYLEKLIPNIPQSLLRKAHMRDHIKVLISDNEVKIVFEDTAFYWRFVENGTANQKAQPFAKPTLEQYKEQIQQIMVGRIIEEMEGR